MPERSPERSPGRHQLVAQGIQRQRRGRRRQYRPTLAAAAQQLDGADHDRAQRLHPVARRQLDRGASRAIHPAPQGPLEGAQLEALGVDLVEHDETGVHACLQRMRAQDPRAECVNRRDEGALGIARELRVAALVKAPAHTLAQLPRRLIGERDR